MSRCSLLVTLICALAISYVTAESRFVGTGSGAGAGTGNAGLGGFSESGVGISSAQNGGVGTGTGTGTANLNLFTGQAGATGQRSGSSAGKGAADR